MKIDSCDRAILDAEDILKVLLQGGDISDICAEESVDVEKYNSNIEQVLEKSKIEVSPVTIDREDFHKDRSKQWNIPDEYLDFDIYDKLISKCSNNEQLERVELEYALFDERGLLPVLRLLFFLVDYFRVNKYVWGVGRGSSVSSYILYLIGIHKVDSIKYDLCITEFLK